MSPEQELELLLAEPEPEALLRAEFAFPGSPKKYVYGIVENNGSWYLTGVSGSFPTWSHFVKWIKSKNVEVISLEQATSWKDQS